MSAFDSIAGNFCAAFVYEKKTEAEAKEAVREKFKRKWKQLHFDKSKELVKAKYEAAMLLLG